MLPAITSRTDEFAPLVDLVLSRPIADTTRDNYGRKLRLFFQWWRESGSPPFSRQLVNSYLSHLQASGLKEHHQKHTMSAIHALVREAAYAGHVDAITLEGVLQIRAPKVVGIRQHRRLTEEEMGLIMQSPDRSKLIGKRDAVLLGLLLYCGFRRDEAVRIEFGHIQLVDDRPAIVNLMGKGRKLRNVPMPRFLLPVVQSWVDAAGLEAGYLLRPLTSKRTGVLDRPMSTDAVWQTVRRHAKRSGIGHLEPHDLRRTFGRRAKLRGADLDQIQQVYGHASPALTQEYIGGTMDFENAVCDLLPVPEGY